MYKKTNKIILKGHIKHWHSHSKLFLLNLFCYVCGNQNNKFSVIFLSKIWSLKMLSIDVHNLDDISLDAFN